MELITTIKRLGSRLAEYGLPEPIEKELREYCLFLTEREDLLKLAQTYHDDIFENNRYTLLEVEELPERDGREQGLLFAVIYLARCELMEQVLEARGIPGQYKFGAVFSCTKQIEKCTEYYDAVGLQGMYRSRLVAWLEPSQYIIGRLTFQVSAFSGPYVVYRSRKDGTSVPLALPEFAYLPDGKRAPAKYAGETFQPQLREEEDSVYGCTFDENGLLIREPVRLKLEEYEKVLAAGDDVLNVHIPAIGKLEMAAVEDAFAQAEMFFAKHYPGKRFRAWVCSSWLLDTGLKAVLKPESNILRFQSKFRIVLSGVNTFSIYWHIFDVQRFLPLTELVPKNSFQKAILERVQAGNSLYSGAGFILWDETV